MQKMSRSLILESCGEDEVVAQLGSVVVVAGNRRIGPTQNHNCDQLLPEM